MITGKELVEKMYSELEYEELDYLLEKAFSEGYEYAQKEYAKKDYKGLSNDEIKVLKEKRSQIAEDLLKNRKSTNRAFISQISDEVAKKEWEKMNPGLSWEERKQVLLERRNKNHKDDLKYFNDLAKKERDSIINSRPKSGGVGIIDNVIDTARKNKKILKKVGIGSAIVGTIGTGLYLSNKNKLKKKLDKEKEKENLL